MASPFRDSARVTCVGCGDGVPAEKTDMTERGALCEACIKGAANQRARELAPKLDDESLRSDKPIDRVVDGAIDVLAAVFHSTLDED